MPTPLIVIGLALVAVAMVAFGLYDWLVRGRRRLEKWQAYAAGRGFVFNHPETVGRLAHPLLANDPAPLPWRRWRLTTIEGEASGIRFTAWEAIRGRGGDLEERRSLIEWVDPEHPIPALYAGSTWRADSRLTFVESLFDGQRLGEVDLVPEGGDAARLLAAARGYHPSPSLQKADYEVIDGRVVARGDPWDMKSPERADEFIQGTERVAQALFAASRDLDP